MTILDERPGTRPAVRSRRRPPVGASGPRPARPPVGPLRYRGSAVAVSAAPHRGGPAGRPVSTSLTVALAGLTALITLWLGWLAQFGDARTAVTPQLPERLAVVVVQAGESLHQLAGRVAPDAPPGVVVERIRSLNELDSASVESGQTLIAPVG